MALALLGSHSALAQEAKLIGVGTLAGTTTDQSGMTDLLGDNTPHNTFGGISGLEYLADKDTFVAVSDRGPKDGAVDWHCRFHLLDIRISDKEVTPSVKSSVLLADTQARPFSGRSTAYAPTQKLAERFDPEGIRVLANGNFLISDEYGPHIIEFTPEGEEVRRIPVPRKLLVQNLGPDKSSENSTNFFGRSCNRGMEGIALSPDGKYLFGLMQSSLLQDSHRDTAGKPSGQNVRLIKMDLTLGTYEEFVYVMESEKHKLHEILPINGNEFLVIENDGEIGELATHKRIYRINVSQASDVRTMPSLPWNGLPTSIKPVGKKLILDMQDKQFGLANDLPEKIEGLAWGPRINESSTLVVASDNDFDAAIETKFYIFQIDLSEPVTFRLK
jgi:hypothetical protein